MRSPIKYLLCFIFMVPQASIAQVDKVTGLAHYIPGLTTPDSLNATDFREQDQPLVKGTLALLCTHVRTFTASQVILEGNPVTNLVLHFYDDRLFRIDCDYNEPLIRFFTRKFGPGISKPVSQFRVCSQGDDKFLTVWGEAWPGEETAAFVVYRKGYTTGCQPEEDARLVLWSQPLSALCSECDLQPTTSLMEEYRQLQQGK
jgi:hypothetical protein